MVLNGPSDHASASAILKTISIGNKWKDATAQMRSGCVTVPASVFFPLEK